MYLFDSNEGEINNITIENSVFSQNYGIIRFLGEPTVKGTHNLLKIIDFKVLNCKF